MRPARILLLRGGALGDFIVTLPVIAALRARWPDAHIELIAYPHLSALAMAGGFINHARSLNDGALARYFAPDAPIRDEDQQYFSSFDFILNFLHDPDSNLTGNLKRCGVQVLISQSPMVCDRHAADHFLQPLASLAIYDADATPRLHLPAKSPANPAGKWIAIHPGSGSRAKNWPLAGFVEIAHRFKSSGREVIFFTGDAEREYIANLDTALSGFTRQHNLPLVELAGWLQTAAGYIGNDSGISHLAAAVGCPSTVIFGPSDPSLWAPRGTHVSIVVAPQKNPALLSTDQVWSAITF